LPKTHSNLTILKRNTEKLDVGIEQFPLKNSYPRLLLLCQFYPTLGVDANRALPQILLLVFLIIAFEISSVVTTLKSGWKLVVSSFCMLAVTILWFSKESKQLQYWAYLNFNQSKKISADIKEIEEIILNIKGSLSDPRVLVENSTGLSSDIKGQDNFYLLPLQSGRAILSGLYIDTVPTSKLIVTFHNQISSTPFCPWSHFNCSGFKEDDDNNWLGQQMDRFGVDTLILRSEKSIAYAGKNEFLINTYKGKNFSVFKSRKNINLVEQSLDSNSLFGAEGKCNPKIKVSYHQIELSNLCIGIKTLIKFNYFPNLVSNTGDVVSKNEDGFMSVTPTSDSLVLNWQSF